MKKFDLHIHAWNTVPDPERLLAQMERAGVYGGCVFSNRPKKLEPVKGTSFDERLVEVLAWSDGYSDRLFPVVWIHPYEDGIIEHIHEAVERGAAAFKIICNDFYVCEDRSMEVLSEIAKCGKAVIFHSGILWDGEASSKYNRPLYWEPLVNIKGLRFSMGHCSWPWHDECIALYGKFLNALTVKSDCAEMFFDITPGTPSIYREELLRKLFMVGYDVPDNLMFGTDGSANDYDSDWVSGWLELDGKIMDGLDIPDGIRVKMYGENLMRFLGSKEKDFVHISPVCDRMRSWYPGMSRK